MRNLFAWCCGLMLLCTLPARAQNEDHPYKFGFGTHFLDYNVEDDGWAQDLIDTGDLVSAWVVNRYTFGTALNAAFVLEGSLAMASLERNPRTNAVEDKLWVGADVGLLYQLANGKVMRHDHWFSPYLTGRVGFNYLSTADAEVETVFPEGKIGIGADIWLTPMFGFNVQSGYTRQFSEAGLDYTQHSVGLVVRFGKGADQDADGIANWQDACPDKAGIPLFGGCPDTDSDGITDAQDACPAQYGPKDLNGCPDADSDGLADKDDTCPTEKGLMQFNGCPDGDSDGIPDKDDRCPKDKGLANFNGCPDTDSDGVSDLDDACRNEKGLKEFNGCPDTDGDKIMDKEDRCPKERGDMSMKGCPDNDGDGVADIDDRCPDKPGVKANAGCPVITEEAKKEIVRKINYAAKSIQFETGSDVIKTSSFNTLDQIVSIMILYPSTMWSIEGHTDAQGEDAMNQVLSDKRAAAVKNYFITKGVDASRLSSVGYGETKPIADNANSSGRAQNRRVEIVLQNQ